MAIKVQQNITTYVIPSRLIPTESAAFDVKFEAFDTATSKYVRTSAKFSLGSLTNFIPAGVVIAKANGIPVTSMYGEIVEDLHGGLFHIMAFDNNIFTQISNSCSFDYDFFKQVQFCLTLIVQVCSRRWPRCYLGNLWTCFGTSCCLLRSLDFVGLDST